MRALIRFLQRGQAGATGGKDRVYEGEALTLGRATDQVLHLKDRRVALQHARILLRGGRPVITSRAAGGIVVNDSLCRDAALAPGDVVRIGANLLTIFEPPAGFDLAFRFELDPEAAAAAEAGAEPPRLDLAAIGWRRRAWSWFFVGAVLTFTLLLPASGLRHDDLRSWLRAGPLPDDAAWLSGPLSAAHGNIGERCEACHQRPFVRVRNDACLACHAGDVSRHYSAAAMPVTRLDSARCATCHAEHNEPPTLVREDEALCVRCHGNLAAIAGAAASSADATDFHRDHPQFRVSLLVRATGGGQPAAWRTRRATLGGEGLHEESGLSFSHAGHLAPAGIDSPDGRRVLACDDCHRPEADGRRMQPVSMEAHCAGCHRLDFDPAFPDATVPHGDPAVVVRRLVEYYSRSYLEGYPDPEAGPDGGWRARRPGALTPRERERLLGLAREHAGRVARDLIERRSCAGCHQVAAQPDAELQWRVLPVRLTREWMPAARFDHASHATSLTGCGHCHAAGRSSEAGDLLMPGIETCRDCHGGGDPRRNPPALVASGCLYCHGFHLPQHGPWPAEAP